MKPKTNILILPISRHSGMAGSTRIRNLFQTLERDEHTSISNLVVKNVSTNGLTRTGDKDYEIGFSKKKPWTLLGFWSGGTKLVRQLFQPDALNVLYVYKDVDVLTYPWVRAAKKLGYKVVVDITEDNRLMNAQYASLAGFVRGYSSFFFRQRANNHLDSYIAISKRLEEIIEAEIPAKFNIPVNFIPTTVDLSEFPEEAGYNSSGLRLFYGGSFGEKDGLDVLLRAVQQIKKDGIDIKLRVSGKANPKLKARFEILVKETNTEDCIQALGFLDRSVYLDELKRASIHCMTRSDSEYANTGFPFKLAEMLATGKPVIASRLQGIHDALGDGTVKFVKPNDHEALADAIRLLHSDDAQARALGLKGREACERLFSSEAVNIEPVLEALRNGGNTNNAQS